MGTTALRLVVSADVGPLQTELQGKGTAAVREFTTTATTGFSGAGKELEKVVPITNQFGEAAKKAGHEAKEEMEHARASMMVLNHELHLGSDRHLNRFITTLPGVGAAMAAAFQFVMVAMLVDMVIKLGEKMHELSKAAHEAAASNKEAWDSVNEGIEKSAHQLNLEMDKSIETRNKLLNASNKDNALRTALDEAIVGADKLNSALDADIKKWDELLKKKEGQVTQGAAFISGVHSTAASTAVLAEVENRLKAAKEIAAEEIRIASESGSAKDVEAQKEQNLVHMQNAYGDVVTIVKGKLAEVIEKQKEFSNSSWVERQLFSIKDYAANITLLQGALDNLQAQQESMGAEVGAEKAKKDSEDTSRASEAASKARTISQAHLSSVKAIAEAEVAASEEANKRRYAAGEITLAQETESLLEAENKRYAIQVEYLNKTLALAKGSPSGQAEVIGIQTQLSVAATQHTGKVGGISAEDAASQKASARSLAEAQIEADEKVAEASVKQANEASKARLALQAQDAEAAQTQEVAEENRLYEITYQAQTKRLELLKTDGEKSAALVLALQGTMQAGLVEHNTKLQAIDDSYAEKKLQKQEARAQRELTSAEATSSRNLSMEEQANSKRLSMGGETTEAWANKERAAISSWYSEQSAIYEKMFALAARLYGKDSSQYAELMAKKAALDQQYQTKMTSVQDKIDQKMQASFARMNTEFTTVLDAWLTGSQSMSRAWASMGDHMVVSLANSLLKMEAQHLQYELMTRMQHVATNAVTTTSDAAAAELSNATTQKSTMKQLFHFAALAAGKAWSALSGIPIVGPVLGAAAAAATFSGIMALAAFEKGGIVGDGPAGFGTEVPILAKPGERVLSNQQTQKFDSLVSSGASQQGGNHFHYSPTISGIDGASVSGMARSYGNVFLQQAMRQMRLANRA